MINWNYADTTEWVPLKQRAIVETLRKIAEELDRLNENMERRDKEK